MIITKDKYKASPYDVLGIFNSPPTPALIDGPKGTKELFYHDRRFAIADGKRTTAFHEAGHVLLHFLAGDQNRVRSIEMTPDAFSLARVKVDLCFLLEVLELSPRRGLQTRQNVSFWQRIGVKEIMALLAGPAAQNLVQGDRPNWMDKTFLDAWAGGQDGARAWQLAGAIEPTCARAWRLLNHTARWTDEIIRHERVWRSLSGLADYLGTHSLVTGAEAFDTFKASWGSPAAPPSAQLPKRYRRLLAPSPYPMWSKDEELPMRDSQNIPF